MSNAGENIAMSEQTPLNPAPAAESTAEGAVSAPANKKWFFTKKTKTVQSSDTATGANNDNNKEDVEAGAHVAKKIRWWHRKPCAEGQEHPCMSIGINMIQRDDHQLQSGIDLGFEDIYGEPDNVHSLDAIWRTNYAVFQSVRSFFYKVFSLIIAIPLAVIFGILFALVSTLSVYFCIPAGRLISIPVWWIASAWRFIVGAIFDPVFNSIGRLFTNIKISRYGINSDPTAVITA